MIDLCELEVLSSNFETNDPPFKNNLRDEEARVCWRALANRFAEVESVMPPERPGENPEGFNPRDSIPLGLRDLSRFLWPIEISVFWSLFLEGSRKLSLGKPTCLGLAFSSAS
jgi:hypothetical protein